VPGDLYIGGDGLALRYRNLPKLTAERFLPHPFERGGNRRVYKTGDIARYRESGDIEYLGRSDQQVKLRGFRIETAEIEAVLTTHPELRHVVVDAREDAAGDKRLIAWYVPAHEQALSAAELRDHLKQKLPDYMIPALFVAMPTLPTTPNGKVDRKALSEPGQEQGRSAIYLAPRTEWEQTLVRLWQEILNVPKLGIHENFFELGGHSLKATAFLARLQRETGVRLGLIDVFRYPSVAALAANCLAEGSDRASIDSHAEEAGSVSKADHGAIRPATADELEILGRL
jgi:Phosphopantetheine attachment site/AMP-binding enzyme/AMP-binding enzyme C-terminal domain